MMIKIKPLLKDIFGSFPSWDNIDSASDFAKVILPVIRRVMPTIIAQDIIGVSPMVGPYESIAKLRARYADSLKDIDNQNDSSYNDPDNNDKNGDE